MTQTLKMVEMNCFNYFFDKKVGVIGGIYEDMNTFKIKHPQVHKIFENAIEQLI